MRSAVLHDMHVSLHDARQAGTRQAGTRVFHAVVLDGVVVTLHRRGQHLQLSARMEHDNADEAIDREDRHAANNSHDRLRDVHHLVRVRSFQRKKHVGRQPLAGRVPRMAVQQHVPERR